MHTLKTRPQPSKAKAAKPPARARAAPPRQVPAPEQAYRTLRQHILDNHLPAGSTHAEQALAERARTTLPPVRAALARLAEEGLVELQPQHEVRITPLSGGEIAEILEILNALEPIAVRHVASKVLKKGDLDRLTAAVRQMDAALLRDDRLAWLKADEAFHVLLLDLCSNRRLAGVLMAYRDQLHRFSIQMLDARPAPVASNRAHGAVVDAVRRGDADAAHSIHQEHLVRSHSMLMSLFESPRRAHG
jgi:DNA-binding GntR family transcriptional regulator